MSARSKCLRLVLICLLITIVGCPYLRCENKDDIFQQTYSPEEFESLNSQAMLQLQELSKIYGNDACEDITSNSRPHKNPNQKINFKKLENVENDCAMTKEELRKNLECLFDLYPANWASNIEVIFENRDKLLANTRPEFKNSEEESVLTAADITSNTQRRMFFMRIYPITIKDAGANPAGFDNVLSHELAHTNDWRCDNGMALWQKVRLFKRTSDRFNAQDHFTDGDWYLNNIYFKSAQQTAYRQIIEYWAVIASEYISGDPYRLPKDDRELVEAFIGLTDPEFNQKQKAAKRIEIVKKIFDKKTADLRQNQSQIKITIIGNQITIEKNGFRP